MKLSAWLRFLGCLSLAGCAVGPDYQHPAVTTPAQFRGAENSPGATHSLADLGWWEVFPDPTLHQLIAEALLKNKDLRLAAARIEEARSVFRTVRGDLLPTIAGTGSYQRAKSTELGSTPIPAIVKNPADTLALVGSASYELDFWGRIRRLTEAARAQLLATEAAQQTIRASLVADVAATYFDLLELDSELSISRSTLASRERSLKLVNSRHDQGVVSGLDVRQAEVLVTTAAKTIPVLERAIGIAENRLSSLLGRNPGDIPRGGSLTNLSPRIEVPAGLPADLLERRPDLRQAEQQLVAANAKVGAAKAAFFPQVTLTASGGQVSAELSDLFQGPANTWSFGPKMTVPLFTAGQLRGQYAASRAQWQQALISYERSVQNAFAETANALIIRAKSQETRQHQQALTAALREAARLSNIRYRGGVTSYLEVLDSERQLFDAELLALRAHRDELTALVQLYLALGGGWKLEPGSPK